MPSVSLEQSSSSYTHLLIRRLTTLTKSSSMRLRLVCLSPTHDSRSIILTCTPGFLAYSLIVCVFAVIMIYKVAPIHGRKNPLIYLSICSTVGSISVMAVKAFGIALKLTFAGNNQFSRPSTYVFMIITAVCILTQMNYFNKALSQFPTNMYVSLPCPCPFLLPLY